MNDLIEKYYSDLARYPLLGREGEIEAFKGLETAEDLFLSNLIYNTDLALIPNSDISNLAQQGKDLSDFVLDLSNFYRDEKREYISKCLGRDNNSDLTSYLKSQSEEINRLNNITLNSNLRLVVNIARYYFRFNNGILDPLDLIQYGNFGLMRAVDKFEYKLGNRFSTYASWWIRQNIKRGVTDKRNSIRVPYYISDMQYHFIKEIINPLSKKFAIDYWKISEDVIMDFIEEENLDWNLKQIRTIRNLVQEPRALNTPIGKDDSALRLLDIIPDSNVKKEIDIHFETESAKIVNNALNKYLTTQEMDIILLRIEGLSLREIGTKYTLTRERIRQIEAKAKRKLFAVPELKKLYQDYLDF